MSSPPPLTPSIRTPSTSGCASFGCSNVAGQASALGVQLTHGETAELHEGFRLLAGNKVVQQIEIKTLKETLVSVGLPATEDVGDIFRVANQQCMADHLTFPEFVLLMTKQVDERMQEELRSAFRHYDKGNTGYVSVAQFCEMLATMGEKSSPDEVNEMMLFADPEGTGRIEYGRFISKLASKLAR